MLCEMKKIPPHVIESVGCLLRPYGVDIEALMKAENIGNGSRYMTAKQASLYCGLSAKTIRDKALAGEIGSIKIGRTDKSRVLIVKADLDNWLEGFSGRKSKMA